MSDTDRSVIDDDEHTDPEQPDIGKPVDLSDPIPDDDDLDVGDLDELVDALVDAAPEVD
jgi:hypothetical protein